MSDRVRKAKWWWRQRLEWLGQKPGNTRNHQELEEARNDSCLQTSWGLWPWIHLDFRLLASKNARQQIYCLPSLWYFVTAALRNLPKHHGVSSPWAWLMRFFSTKNTLSSLPAWTLPIHPSHPTHLFQVDFVDSLEEYWLQAGRGRAGDSIGPARQWYCFFQPLIGLLFPS